MGVDRSSSIHKGMASAVAPQSNETTEYVLFEKSFNYYIFWFTNRLKISITIRNMNADSINFYTKLPKLLNIR